MNVLGHAAVGAAAALAPDAVLACFMWRREWLPRTHPLVRAHAFVHGPGGLAIAVALGFATHVVSDHYSDHRVAPGVRGRRAWRW